LRSFHLCVRRYRSHVGVSRKILRAIYGCSILDWRQRHSSSRSISTTPEPACACRSRSR
jgi:hypothetical protein